MKSFIGIDFGACNIKAAKVSFSGRSQKIKLNKSQSGGNFIPNVILYDKIIDKNSGAEKIEIKIGNGAQKSLDNENKIWQIKPKLSQKNWSKYIESLGREVSAFEAVKDIFSRLWQTIIEKFSKDEDWDVTITVPVSFSEVQKNLIRQAATDAGIPVNSIVIESFAAMFSLEEFVEEADEETVLIFDFGGSTLDLSLFRLERDDDELTLTELAAAGLKFGGIDIDKAIYKNIFKTKYADKVEKILQSGVGVDELMELVEGMKKLIFIDEDHEPATDSLHDKNGNLHEFTLTHEDIISVLEKIEIRKKIISLLDELFDDAEIDKSEVTAVKPFGGTVSIDYFLQMLTDYFGEDIFDSEDVDKDEIYMAVASGAAKFGYIANQNNSGVTIQNVIPYSIGLVQNGLFNRYIKRNELSGFTTPLKPLLISELKKNNWRVAVYQSFSNEFDLPQESEEVVFIGDVKLNEKLYTVNDAILFNLRTDGAGQIYFKLFELQPDKDEPVFIEEKIVKVGG